MSARILVVEDDSTFRSLLSTLLEEGGYDVVAATNAEKGLELLRRKSFDLVLSDLKLPGMSGLELFRIARQENLAPPFIVLTAFGSIAEAVAATRDGVADFLTKPLPGPETLRQSVARALDDARQERAYQSLKDEEENGLPPPALIFAGAAMQPLQRLIAEVAPTPATVLISGESGTGKELVARTIHRLSPRRSAPFVAVNCAALPENLLESELFGHEKGAFTGAVQLRRGRFELADGGSLFLDEIGELPLSLQAKLLRVLQERSFERVGGSREIRADLRIIAATNRSLRSEVENRRFREDLFYRLNVFPLHLPPLRERTDSLPELVDYLIRRFAVRSGKKLRGIDPAALRSLQNYRWPGNIRELQNVIERAVILARQRIELQDLPVELQRPERGVGNEPLLAVAEREAIATALRESGGNRRLAAERLGMAKRTLQYRLKRYRLEDDGEEQD